METRDYKAVIRLHKKPEAVRELLQIRPAQSPVALCVARGIGFDPLQCFPHPIKKLASKPFLATFVPRRGGIYFRLSFARDYYRLH